MAHTIPNSCGNRRAERGGQSRGSGTPAVQLRWCGRRSSFPGNRLRAPFHMPPTEKVDCGARTFLFPRGTERNAGSSALGRRDTELCVQRSSLSADEVQQTAFFRGARNALRYSSHTETIARLGQERSRFAPREAQHESSERPGTDANSPLKKARTRCMRVWKSSGKQGLYRRQDGRFQRAAQGPFRSHPEARHAFPRERPTAKMTGGRATIERTHGISNYLEFLDLMNLRPQLAQPLLKMIGERANRRRVAEVDGQQHALQSARRREGAARTAFARSERFVSNTAGGRQHRSLPDRV